jgi:hypothetical protein
LRFMFVQCFSKLFPIFVLWCASFESWWRLIKFIFMFG